VPRLSARRPPTLCKSTFAVLSRGRHVLTSAGTSSRSLFGFHATKSQTVQMTATVMLMFGTCTVIQHGDCCMLHVPAQLYSTVTAVCYMYLHSYTARWLLYATCTVCWGISTSNPLTLELNPSALRCLTRFLLGILLLEPCISSTYAWKTNKYTNYSFSLLIMYGTSYMFRHYIAILRERS
jgi:hypothetical protein